MIDAAERSRMSRSAKAKLKRPRSGIKSNERRIEHQRHRSRERQKLHENPDLLPKQEGLWDAGDIWNWD